MKWIIATALLAFLGCVQAQPRIVSTEGTAKIEVVPDIVRISFTVKHSDPHNVAKAKAEVDRTAEKAVHALMAAGVEKADITSNSLSVETAEKYDEHDNAVEVGYVVRRKVDVVLRRLKQYNAVIQALVDSGISDIGSVSPDVSNLDALKRKALAGATADARNLADFLASQLGARVVRVHRIGRQQTQDHFSMQEIVITAFARREGPGVRSTPYEFSPGTISVSSKIYVEFEIE